MIIAGQIVLFVLFTYFFTEYIIKKTKDDPITDDDLKLNPRIDIFMTKFLGCFFLVYSIVILISVFIAL